MRHCCCAASTWPCSSFAWFCKALASAFSPEAWASWTLAWVSSTFFSCTAMQNTRSSVYLAARTAVSTAVEENSSTTTFWPNQNREFNSAGVEVCLNSTTLQESTDGVHRLLPAAWSSHASWKLLPGVSHWHHSSPSSLEPAPDSCSHQTERSTPSAPKADSEAPPVSCEWNLKTKKKSLPKRRNSFQKNQTLDGSACCLIDIFYST